MTRDADLVPRNQYRARKNRYIPTKLASVKVDISTAVTMAPALALYDASRSVAIHRVGEGR